MRGLACLALVAYHVIGPASSSGMHLPDSSGWHHVMNAFDFLRMPMFTVLSGFLYASRRAELATLRPFFVNKARRLLIPFLVATSVIFLIKTHLLGESVLYRNALLHHYEHLWFLQALILIFSCVAIWDALARPGWAALAMVSFGAVMIARTFAITDFFSINGAVYLLPYFLTGMLLASEPVILRRREVSRMAVGIVIMVLATQQGSLVLGGNELTRFSLPAALCGIGGSLLMLMHCPRIGLADRIGRYSFTIYLWHSAAASAMRHLLRAHVSLPIAAEFVILLLVGIGVPMLIHRLVVRIPVVATMIAGVRSPTLRRGPAAPVPAEAATPSAIVVDHSNRVVRGRFGKRKTLLAQPAFEPVREVA